MHRLTQCLSNPWADDRRVEDDRCRPSWRVNLHKLLEMILGLVFIMLSTPVWLWFPSETSLAVSLLLSLTSSPSSRCISHSKESPLLFAHPYPTICQVQLPAPKPSLTTLIHMSVNPYCPLGILSSSVCDYSASPRLVLTLYPVLYWPVQSQRTRRYEKVSPKRSYSQN